MAAAHAAYNTARLSCEASVARLLSASQRAAWAAMRGGIGSEMPMRLVALTPQQRLDFGRERRHYNWRHAAGRTKANRAASRTAHASAVDQILSVDQQAVVDAYQEYAETASQAVAAAFDTVLPLVEGT